MSRITIIALLFPPIQQIGARRPLRLANHLVRQGHRVTVYAVHPRTPGLGDYTGVDPATLSEIDPRVRVIRTPSFHGFKIIIGWRDRWRRRRGGPGAGAAGTPVGGPAPSPKVASSAATTSGGVKQVISRIQGWFAIPDTFTGWIVTTLPGLLVRSILRRPHAIYVTAPPWSPLILGVLTGKLLRVPVHVDFRDPWTLNPYVQAPPLSVRLERWVVRNSASLMATTEVMAQNFRRVYPECADRVLAVYNGYDQKTRRRIEELRRRTPRRQSGKFVVCHLGTLYPARMPRSLAELLAQVAVGWGQPRPLRFRFLGRVWEPATLIEAFASAGIGSALELPGEVGSQEALGEAVGADVLLLLQLGTSQQVPAKLFEYVFTGNPLVCAADEGSETARLVEKYHLGHVLSSRESADALLRYLEGQCRGSIVTGRLDKAFEGDFDGERLAEVMSRVVLAGGSPSSSPSA
ncbi:MAG: hypothetical protein NTV05_11675 [Acidobacteria bacterium]|nr:hypothetical protein [Acidobacteriota bacterium]